MATLDLRGLRYTLYLEAARQSVVGPLFLDELRVETRGYRYTGQGSILSPIGIERFLFATTPAKEDLPLCPGLIFDVEPFDELCGESRGEILRRLARKHAFIVDRACEMWLQTIQVWKQGFAESDQPEICFVPLTREFLAQHLLGKRPLLFPA